jgi:hypothetical protein
MIRIGMLFLAASGCATAPKIERREVIMQTRPSGASVTTILPDGTIEHDFQYLQNGRGPKIKARVKLAADATIAAYEAEGTQERGLPVKETFSIANGRARWSSSEESGEAEYSAPAFYWPIAGAPELYGLLFSALQKHGGKLALLPGGTATLTREIELTVKNTAGEEKSLAIWAIGGLDFAPARVVAEEDGSFFGVADEWFSCRCSPRRTASTANASARSRRSSPKNSRTARRS